MNRKRHACIKRVTAETKIELELALDGTGEYKVETGIGFFDHMLELFSKHGFFDLTLACECDLKTGEHHCVEDIGICLGQGINKALGERVGISRYGMGLVPMDESLARAVIDLSRRPYLAFEANFKAQEVGGFQIELAKHFFKALTDNAKMTLHIDLIRGAEGHHGLESIFKAFARALDQASSIEKRVEGVPSTKGKL